MMADIENGEKGSEAVVNELDGELGEFAHFFSSDDEDDDERGDALDIEIKRCHTPPKNQQHQQSNSKKLMNWLQVCSIF